MSKLMGFQKRFALGGLSNPVIVKSGKSSRGGRGRRAKRSANLTPSDVVSTNCAYDAYGNLIGFNPATALTNLLYSGEQFDQRIAMQYLRARYYGGAAPGSGLVFGFRLLQAAATNDIAEGEKCPVAAEPEVTFQQSACE